MRSAITVACHALLPDGGHAEAHACTQGHSCGPTACARRFLDAYAGKSAYLPSAGLENRARRTQFPKLKFVKYNASADPLAAIGASVITMPQPTADWGNFSLVDLDGNLTYPMLTTAMVASAKDLSGKGNRGNAQKQVSPRTELCPACAPGREERHLWHGTQDHAERVQRCWLHQLCTGARLSCTCCCRCSGTCWGLRCRQLLPSTRRSPCRPR